MNNHQSKTPQTRYQPNPVKLLLFFALSVAVIGGGLLGSTLPAQAAPPAQAPTTNPSVSAGQSKWAENCMPCHGANGHGDGPTAQSLPNQPPDFADPENARNYVPTELFDTIKNGRMDKMMPPWKNRLSDSEVWEAAAYVWRLGTTQQALEQGETVYTEQCAACHGADGTGSGPNAPDGINNFTDLTVMTGLSQANLMENYNASSQHAELSNLSEDDIWASLDYARTFTFAVPQRNGILTGQVINAGTGEPVGNIPVTLHAIQNNSEVDTITGQADADGNYVFEKLPTDHSIMYVVEGSYKDVPYFSQDTGMFVPDSNETSVNLEVFDTTTSDEAISITQLHYLLSFTPDTINVMQIYVVGNNGNATYVGQNGQTFNVALPQNATNINFQNNPNNSRFVETGDGYADTSPIMPGKDGLTIAALYDIPYNSDSATIEFPLVKSAASVDVLMTDQGATLSSDQVDFVENRTFQGTSFAVFNGANLPQGEMIRLNLAGLDSLDFSSNPIEDPGSSAAGVDTTTWFDQELAKWGIVAATVLAVVVAGVVYPMSRQRFTGPTDQPGQDPETRRKKLLLTLAKLDETFENGELDEDVYRRARAKYKAQLADLLEQN
ncbi:MAG: hypothetical protein D6768_12915 [Chloroflexi bacterium]|nr:MAG: hypothetical protein D6768_12915 [Chloroflexota bacterium]